MTSPTVSILIPCRNAARWLRPCVESALAQELSAEVLVWDDGSTDDSRDILRSFEPRIRWFAGEPRGGNAARNQLLHASRGEWVQFLDADDWLEPGKISRQLAEVGGGHDVDVIYSPVWIDTWRDGHAVDRTKSDVTPADDLFTQWFNWHLPQTGGAFWRRAPLLALGGWREGQPCCQEHELYARALRAGLRFRFAPTPGAVYRIWSEQTVCRQDPVRVIRVKAQLLEEMLAWLSEQNRLLPAHRAAASRVFFELSRTWTRHDLEAAADFFRGKKAAGLMLPRGPAAPIGYRFVLALAGFKAAERFGRILRARRRPA